MSGAVEQRIKEIIIEQLGVEESQITDDSTMEGLGADSLDEIEMIMSFEEEFDIEIPDEDAEKLTTFKEVNDYILDRI